MPARTLATAATARAGPKPTCLHRMYSNETSGGALGGPVCANSKAAAQNAAVLPVQGIFQKTRPPPKRHSPWPRATARCRLVHSRALLRAHRPEAACLAGLPATPRPCSCETELGLRRRVPPHPTPPHHNPTHLLELWHRRRGGRGGVACGGPSLMGAASGRCTRSGALASLRAQGGVLPLERSRFNRRTSGGGLAPSISADQRYYFTVATARSPQVRFKLGARLAGVTGSDSRA